ncbi:hypothetical protein ABZ454_10890 [Streptomyces sp. NPDC005803]|uniref:DUF7848 domain-containing protein n=1 Tax=Streptomyces sp. NPDC005803 TaxID=3154297 RepID=UPI003403B613
MATIIRAAEWTLGPETAQGAPRGALYEAECTTCADGSGAEEGTRVPAEVWALKHTGENPTHRNFRAVITSFWAVSPAASNPYSGEGQ